MELQKEGSGDRMLPEGFLKLRDLNRYGDICRVNAQYDNPVKESIIIGYCGSEHCDAKECILNNGKGE